MSKKNEAAYKTIISLCNKIEAYGTKPSRMLKSLGASMEALSNELEEYDDMDFSEDEYDDIPEDEGYGNEYTEEEAVSDPGFDSYEEDAEAMSDAVVVSSDAPVINIMELAGTLMNSYLVNMSEFYDKNKGVLDDTGDFKNAAIYEKFVVPSHALISKCAENSDIVKRLDNLMGIVTDKKKMSVVTGTKTSPYIYEIIQMVTIELLRQLTAVIPITLVKGSDLEDEIRTSGYTNIVAVLDAAEALVEFGPMYDERLTFIEPGEPKEMSLTNEEINVTPYVDSVAFESFRDNYNPMQKTYSATESIMNLIELRNNKVLMEFSLIMKIGVLVTSLLKDVSLASNCNSVLSMVTGVLNHNTSDITGLEDKIEETIATLKEDVIMKGLTLFGEVDQSVK